MRTFAVALAAALCATAPAAVRAHAGEWPHAAEHGQAAAPDAPENASAHGHGAREAIPVALRAVAGAAVIALAFGAVAAWHRRRRRG